jgi:hypothetical protein
MKPRKPEDINSTSSMQDSNEDRKHISPKPLQIAGNCDLCSMTFRHTIYVILCAVLLSGCSKQLLQSNWHSTQKTDGTFRFYHPDSKIRYNITNDSAHVYLTMDVTDRLTMMKILRAGMRVFLGDAGKKKERNELQFPIYIDKYELTENDMHPAMQPIDRAGEMDRMLPNEGYLKYMGKATSVFPGVPLDNGLQVSMKFDKDRALIYEAAIPLALLGMEKDNAPIVLGIETGSFKLPQGEIIQQSDITSGQQLTAGDRAMGRGVGMGMGMDPTGMNTPQGSANIGLNQRTLARYNVIEEPVRFWVTIQLAAPAN